MDCQIYFNRFFSFPVDRDLLFGKVTRSKILQVAATESNGLQDPNSALAEGRGYQHQPWTARFILLLQFLSQPRL